MLSRSVARALKAQGIDIPIKSLAWDMAIESPLNIYAEKPDQDC